MKMVKYDDKTIDEKFNKINKKLNEILSNEKIILENESRILKEEDKVEKEEEFEIKEEEDVKKEEEELIKDVLTLKKKIENPIKKITLRDLSKGFIGALVGVLGHFAFIKGLHISEDLNFLHSTLIYLLSFILIVVMLYFTDFRKIKIHFVLKFMPVRVFILYAVSLFTIILVYFIFNAFPDNLTLLKLYNIIAPNMLLASLGACTADLIGSE